MTSQKGRKSGRKAAGFLEIPMRGSYVIAGGSLVALMLVITAWLVLLPMRAATLLQDQARQQLSGDLVVKGGAHLSFAPLAFTFEQVSLNSPGGMEDRFISAQQLSIPIGLAQLFGVSPDHSAMTLEGADIALLVDERDRVSWNFATAAAAAPLSLHLKSSAIRYFDARNGQSLAIGNVNGDVNIGNEGRVTFLGSSELRGRLARFDMQLKSMRRLHEDGSPFTLSFETPEITAGFDGRLSVANVLNIAGPIDISVTNLRQAARWAGLAIEDGPSYGALSISGGFDSSGRAFAIRNATVSLDQSEVFGDLVIDTRNAVPKLQAKLSAPHFVLDGFVPASSAKPGEWGRSPAGFATLKQFDAEVTLETPAFSYGSLRDQPARLVAASTGGKLQASVTVRPGDGSSLTAGVTIDSSASPHVFIASVAAEGVNAGMMLPVILGVDWLSGSGSFAADLTGSGETQEEIIGTLKGKASLSLNGGAIAGPDVVALLGQTSQRIVDGWLLGAPSRTAFSAFTADFAVADGIATISDLKLDNPAIKVTATGDIDLLRRAVDLKADPNLVAADGTLSGLAVKIAVKGPWAAPRIYPDVEGLLLDPRKGFETLKSLGLKSSLTSGN